MRGLFPFAREKRDKTGCAKRVKASGRVAREFRKRP